MSASPRSGGGGESLEESRMGGIRNGVLAFAVNRQLVIGSSVANDLS